MVGRIVANQKDVQLIANDVHKVWMKLNPGLRKTNPELFVDYTKLPPTEQVKHVDKTLQILKADTYHDSNYPSWWYEGQERTIRWEDRNLKLHS